jgi:hypothetical protein
MLKSVVCPIVSVGLGAFVYDRLFYIQPQVTIRQGKGKFIVTAGPTGGSCIPTHMKIESLEHEGLDVFIQKNPSLLVEHKDWPIQEIPDRDDERIVTINRTTGPPSTYFNLNPVSTIFTYKDHWGITRIAKCVWGNTVIEDRSGIEDTRPYSYIPQYTCF